jgi:predicted GNAT superfamily acetyltransferase
VTTDEAAVLAGEARAIATTAAASAGVTVGDLTELAELEDASALFDRVWGRAADAGAIVATEMLRAMQHAGCQISGAFGPDGAMVGATAALLGRSHDDGHVHLHSHITGIVAGDRGRGVGWALKQHQRAWCLERGIASVRWTFDPLVRRNAVFNLVKLGARAAAWIDDAYGPMPDALNAGLPTDRLVASWELAEPRVARAATGAFAEPQVEALRRAGAVEVLRDADGEPERLDAGGPRLLVQVPADIEDVRRSDPERARRWAEALRATLGAALRGEHRVTGFTRDGWYVLARDEQLEELR